MKLFLKSLLILSIIASVFPLKSYADTSCQPIYGGGQSCITSNNIVIDKTVLNPQTNQFVDNLSINSQKYQPGFVVTFQISITNTSNTTISKIDIKDIFPQYINFGSGAGTFDTNTNTLTFSLDNLAPNETRKYSIVGRIFSTEKLPGAEGSIVCVVNQAIGIIDGKNVSQDNAQLCIEKSTPVTTKGGFPVLSTVPATTTPSTGAEAFALFALIPAGISGLMLRKYSGKKRDRSI